MCCFFRRQLREEQGIPQTAALTAVIVEGVPDAYVATGIVIGGLVVAAIAIFLVTRHCRRRRDEPGKNRDQESLESSGSSAEPSPKPAAAAGCVDNAGASDAGSVAIDLTCAAPAAANPDKEGAVDSEEETAKDKDKDETSKDEETAEDKEEPIKEKEEEE